MSSMAVFRYFRRKSSLCRFSGSVFLLASLLSMLLVACGQAGASQAAGSSPQNEGKGTLVGDVVAGPTCPVEPADGSCLPKPVAFRQVQIMAGNRITATTMTDKQGHFTITLAPGNYSVVVHNVSPGVQRREQAIAVNIVAGQVRTLKIVLDTGIR